MSPKAKTVYRCTNCGADHPKWAGRCDICGEWNSLVEEMAARATASSASGRRVRGQQSMAEGGSVAPTPRLRDIKSSAGRRLKTGIKEFDFVLGGGSITGVASGFKDLDELTAGFQPSDLVIVAARERLHGSAEDVALLNETLLETIIATAGSQQLDAIVVDSIQTVFTSDLEGAPGNVGQVRECAARLMRFAKETETTVFAVGHVTKGGGIAGPKTLEHIVDTVLYFEGEGMLEHRVLRATKNRFGSVDEIGVFRMTEEGLIAVENPSELFLGDRLNNSSGSAVTALLEGTRPVLIEIQGLAAKAGYGTPQRVSTGYDGRRLALLLAVLDKRAGLSFSQLDVFLNVVGGVRMQEPAGDLAVASALASSVYDRPVSNSAIFLGEVGLGGEIRPVSQAERRLGEAAKMGMTTAYMAERGIPKRSARGIDVVGVRTINDLFRQLFHG